MAESACLRRSFSNPSEGDPMRALGESISFGRYMSENLNWEKWSTFSQNRYLEEAEKSSKPGSVAKMKAYFEAHYGKIGAKKQVDLEQADDDSNFLVSEVIPSLSSPALHPETEIPSSVSTVNELRRSLSSPALNPVTALPKSSSTVDAFPCSVTPDVEPLLSAIVRSCDSSTQTKETQEDEASILEPSTSIDYKECPPAVQVYQFEDAAVDTGITESSIETKVTLSTDVLESGIILTTPEREVTIEKKAEDKLDPRKKQKRADSSLKSSNKSNASKLSSSLARLSTPVRPKKEGSGTFSNASKLTSSLAKLATPNRPKMEGIGTPTNHKSVKEAVEKKSTNVDSDVKLKRKSSPASHKTGIGKIFTPMGKMIRQSFVHTPAPSISRASVNSVSRLPSATPQSETKRSRVALEKSFTRNRSLDQKLQSPSVSNVKSPAPPSITFSPFSFRTEERAAKRREFFERLEKEAANQKMLDNAKVKSKTDFKNCSQSVNFSRAPVDIKREILSDKTKIPIARPHPPKCESKISTNLARGKSSRPPQSTAGFKPASVNKSISVTVPNKKRHENASPNIL